eukprot:gene25185-biopygen17982
MGSPYDEDDIDQSRMLDIIERAQSASLAGGTGHWRGRGAGYRLQMGSENT